MDQLKSSVTSQGRPAFDGEWRAISLVTIIELLIELVDQYHPGVPTGRSGFLVSVWQAGSVSGAIGD